jgi:hypothetical protein
VGFRSAGVSPAAEVPGDKASRNSDAPPQDTWLLSAPGRVEPASEDVKLGAEVSGKLKIVLVEEGDSMRKGVKCSNTPDPIFTIGDKRALRVRMDVDEADVSRLALGQSAYVTADAYGDQKFWGHIVRIGQELGRKNVRTDEPTERVDSKILETLVQLDNGFSLPVGLRVDAFVVSGNPRAK